MSFFQVSYWYTSPAVSVGMEDSNIDKSPPSSKFEMDPVDINAGVEIVNIRKVSSLSRYHGSIDPKVIFIYTFSTTIQI